MNKLDAGLRFLQAQSDAALDELVEGRRSLLAKSRGQQNTQVRLLAQFSGDLAALARAGLAITSVAGDVVAGFGPLARLEQIAAVEGLRVVEQSRPMRTELDVSMPATRADLVHAGPPARRGAGVIVGVIDSGIDWRHGCFRRADGSSRILRIWDQRLAPVAGESSPAGFGYGVEYTRAQIDAHLLSATPAVPVRHDDTNGHGTHVAGIAAGNGSPAGDGRPAFTFVGMAPEADIVIVANSIGADSLGDSANTLDGASWIFALAASLGKACVINQSQGDYIGPHDGTSLLERGIDTLLRTKGRAMVKSAGNAALDDAHAMGKVPAGGILNLPMNVASGDGSDDTVDIWYEGADRFGFSIVPPGGAASAQVLPASTTTLTLPNGNRVFVDSTLNNPFNHDNRIFVRLQRGTGAAIRAGIWTLRLHGLTVSAGTAHAWIQRGNGPRFLAPVVSNRSTISIPGTGRRLITVGSYVTKGAGVGGLSDFSSRGPTRDGRTKPEISAPGEEITSALSGASGTAQYVGMSGTSMAAPHVTGAVALMLQRTPSATVATLRKRLTTHAAADAFTGATPNTDWGFGKLDAKASL
jgi:subtilisin family serine protease